MKLKINGEIKTIDNSNEDFLLEGLLEHLGYKPQLVVVELMIASETAMRRLFILFNLFIFELLIPPIAKAGRKVSFNPFLR